MPSRRSAIEGASNGEAATMSARTPSRRSGAGAAAPPGATHSARSRANRKIEPPPGIVGKRKLAAHQADELQRDCKPKTRALDGPRLQAVALLEAPRRWPPPRFGHARPGVDDGEPGAAPPRSTVTQTPPRSVNLTALPARLIRTWRSRSASARTKRGATAADRSRDLEALALCARRKQFDHALDQRAEIERLVDQLEPSSLDLREIEDLVDERRSSAAPELRIAST